MPDGKESVTRLSSVPGKYKDNTGYARGTKNNKISYTRILSGLLVLVFNFIIIMIIHRVLRTLCTLV